MKKLLFLLVLIPSLLFGQITIENTENSIKFITTGGSTLATAPKTQVSVKPIGAMVYFYWGGSSLYKARYSEIDAPATANISDLIDTLNVWLGQPSISVLQSANGNQIDINDSGQLKVVLDGMVDDNNSSAAPLAGDGVFTGWASNTLDYSLMFINVYSDEASATNGLMIQQSSDSTNWDIDDVYTISADTGKTFSIQLSAKYIRIVYTNGSTIQTAFRLQSILKKTNSKPSSHRVLDSISGNDDAELSKAILTGLTPSGKFANVNVTNGQNLKMSLEELENDISVNSNSQLKVSVYDPVGYPMSIDSSTNTLQIIDYEHHEIHSGSHYYVCGFEALADADSSNFSFTTPNTTEEVHLIFDVSGTSRTEFYIYEASTITAGDTITPINNNRRSVKTSNTVVIDGPTISAAGDLIFSSSKGFEGTNPSSARNEGLTDRNREIILKQNTSYIFIIISRDDTNIITFCGEWYEHTPKN